MAKRTILLEGYNLTLPSGTGIATYVRQLGKTLNQLGYDADVVVSSTRDLKHPDPVLREIMFFENMQKLKHWYQLSPPQMGRIARQWLFGSPLGLKPHQIGRTHGVVDPAPGRFDHFQRLSAVTNMDVVEYLHFRRLGSRLTLKPANKPDLFHVTRPAPLQVRGCPNIYTIHDLVPLRLPYTSGDNKRYHLKLIRELCAKADHIVTVSEFSRKDIIALTGIDERRITNTYQAVSFPQDALDRTDADVARELEAYFGLGLRDYYLFVGALEPKKNVSRLINAYATSGVSAPLIIAGAAGWMHDAETAKIGDEQFLRYQITDGMIAPKRRVRRLPFVPATTLVSLIRGAKALLFPSLFEGFGLPVLEAMMLGTPVMTSNVSSLPEIAGDAAVLIDPYDAPAMAKAIARLDGDRDLREHLAVAGRLQAAKFSAAAYGERMRDLYGRLL